MDKKKDRIVGGKEEWHLISRVPCNMIDPLCSAKGLFHFWCDSNSWWNQKTFIFWWPHKPTEKCDTWMVFLEFDFVVKSFFASFDWNAKIGNACLLCSKREFLYQTFSKKDNNGCRMRRRATTFTTTTTKTIIWAFGSLKKGKWLSISASPEIFICANKTWTFQGLNCL